jgi:hypothetical protein
MSLVGATYDDARMGCAIGLIGGYHTSVMALQKRADLFKFHAASP